MQRLALKAPVGSAQPICAIQSLDGRRCVGFYSAADAGGKNVPETARATGDQPWPCHPVRPATLTRRPGPAPA